MRYFSTFTGIGGFEVGIKNASILSGTGVEPICVGYSEIDKYAISVFENNFKGIKNYGDITKIKEEELPDFDCLVGGFPCQAFSIAGKRGGFEDTRGTLFFDLARILRAKQPRLFVFENVKGLLSHDDGNTFRTIIATIDELGYDCQWQVLNSKNHGVPQNRERIYFVGHLRGTPRPKVFPLCENDNPFTTKGGRQPSDAVVSRTLTATDAKMHLDGNYINQINNPKHSNERVYASDGISPTLNTMQGGLRQPFVAAVLTPDRLEKRQRGRRMKGHNEPSFTVTAHDIHGVAVRIPEATKKGYAEATPGQAINLSVPNSKTRRGRVSDIAPTLDTGMQLHTFTDDIKIRRLTPIECERLQAFPDGWTEKGVILKSQITEPISDSQRYKMCGNAVTTNVVRDVFEKIFLSEEGGIGW